MVNDNFDSVWIKNITALNVKYNQQVITLNWLSLVLDNIKTYFDELKQKHNILLIIFLHKKNDITFRHFDQNNNFDRFPS